MCFQDVPDLNSSEIAGSPPVQRGALYVDWLALKKKQEI